MDQDVLTKSEKGVEEPLEEHELKVTLSTKAKNKIRQKWLTSLIVKVFGKKNVGYNYLKWKIQELWKPKGQMDVIDLGDGYFITRFVSEEDM